MLAEGFLRVLRYREERKSDSDPKRKEVEHRTYFMNPIISNSDSNSTDQQTDSTEAGLNKEELDLTQCQHLNVVPQDPEGLSIPGCLPVVNVDFTVCLDSCSLLEKYPDLQVADPGYVSHNQMNSCVSEVGYHPVWSVQQEPQGEPALSYPDQGYLVMGANVSLDLPGSGLEPMSNSLLNGLLDKQLDEVYMQHLTDNLARCNSNLRNSLLHGLLPPPKPSSQLQGLDSLETGLEEASGGTISYLRTQNIVPCSSNFSSPVLRISELANPHPQ